MVKLEYVGNRFMVVRKYEDFWMESYRTETKTSFIKQHDAWGYKDTCRGKWYNGGIEASTVQQMHKTRRNRNTHSINLFL